MSKVCQVTGKKAMVGNHVSHAKNRVKRLLSQIFIATSFGLNLKKFITLTVSAKGMRIIDKKGIDVVLSDIRSKGIKV